MEKINRILVLPLAIVAALVPLASSPARAVVEIDINRANVEPLPIAITDFVSNDELGQQIAAVVTADLKRSGLFAPISPNECPMQWWIPLDDHTVMKWDVRWNPNRPLTPEERVRLKADDPGTFTALTAEMEAWPDQRIVHRDEMVSIDGNGFSAIGRLKLLQLLHGLCTDAGVGIEFEAEIETLDTFAGCDLVVGADGINTLVRELHADALRPTIKFLTNRFVW